MTLGVGGSTAEQELQNLTNMAEGVAAISEDEFQARLKKAKLLMKKHNIDALYLNAGTNLYYFTGMRWSASERMVGAFIFAKGDVEYIGPAFEEGTLQDFMQIEGKIHGWQEHENPYALVGDILNGRDVSEGVIAIDESTPFFIVDGIRQAHPNFQYMDAKVVTAGCRQSKSEGELALLQRAKDMTLEVHKAAARILYEGISVDEVTQFIHQAHKKVGAPKGSYFCIVLFGEDSAYPHGVRQPKHLEKNDMVLIDTGCQLQGYNSDITRTYVFGEINARQRQVWDIEKAAQKAAFEAAKIGEACSQVDQAARDYLTQKGFGPGYDLPGLPHRTGHGVGLDIHEWPYLVGGNDTPLAKGMCFSNEPMICIPGEFGIRLEDHFYMTDEGPQWFTQPSHSIDDPFGYEA